MKINQNPVAKALILTALLGGGVTSNAGTPATRNSDVTRTTYTSDTNQTTDRGNETRQTGTVLTDGNTSTQ